MWTKIHSNKLLGQLLMLLAIWFDFIINKYYKWSNTGEAVLHGVWNNGTENNGIGNFSLIFKQNLNLKRSRDWSLLQKVREQGVVASYSEMT